MPAVSGLPDVSSRGRFAGLMGVGFGLSAAAVFLGVLNHDVAWYLVAAGCVLDGERLYVEVVETNPPLIVWMSALPQVVAKGLGISLIVTVRLMVLALVVGSLGLTRSVLKAAWADPAHFPFRRGVLAFGLFALIPLAGYDFAQREHLMLILLLPFLMMAGARAKGMDWPGALPWVVGLMAAVGLALKPHFVLVWLAIECWLMASRRSVKGAIRPESLAIVAVGLIYAALILTITPDYLRLMRWAGPVYSASGHATIGALASEPATILTVVAALGFLAIRPTGEGRECLAAVLVANLGLLAIAVAQNKGYSYHFYPPMALAELLIGMLVVESFGQSPRASRLFVWLIRGVLAALVLSSVIARANESRVWRGSPGESDTTLGRMIRVARLEAKGTSLFVFSPAVPAGFPMATYAEATWASRHPALWFLPAFYPPSQGTAGKVVPHALASMDPTERFLFDSVVEKLLADRPALLFVDEREKPSAFGDRSFPFLEYYAQDPRFVRFLDDYEPFTKVEEFRAYRRKARN